MINSIPARLSAVSDLTIAIQPEDNRSVILGYAKYIQSFLELESSSRTVKM